MKIDRVECEKSIGAGGRADGRTDEFAYPSERVRSKRTMEWFDIGWLTGILAPIDDRIMFSNWKFMRMAQLLKHTVRHQIEMVPMC